MDDPFASIVSECIIRLEVEETLCRAPIIGEPYFFSGICSLDGQSLPAAPNPNKLSEIRRIPDSTSNLLDDEGLRDIPAACKGSSSFPLPRLRLDDFTALINNVSQNSDRSLRRQDILEIAKSKGLSLPPPKWWRPGGYEMVIGCHEAFPF
ncbi:hypothetical protein M5K25_005727 [Dendrobium thyrsiflorum]|uniref:Uncharacterized protein n=1 Tax=Dendrobium thyrsiflorum TaxID=117978 RepID=A0ABD0VII0_DENTH